MCVCVLICHIEHLGAESLIFATHVGSIVAVITMYLQKRALCTTLSSVHQSSLVGLFHLYSSSVVQRLSSNIWRLSLFDKSTIFGVVLGVCTLNRFRHGSHHRFVYWVPQQPFFKMATHSCHYFTNLAFSEGLFYQICPRGAKSEI